MLWSTSWTNIGQRGKSNIQTHNTGYMRHALEQDLAKNHGQPPEIISNYQLEKLVLNITDETMREKCIASISEQNKAFHNTCFNSRSNVNNIFLNRFKSNIVSLSLIFMVEDSQKKKQRIRYWKICLKKSLCGKVGVCRRCRNGDLFTLAWEKYSLIWTIPYKSVGKHWILTIMTHSIVKVRTIFGLLSKWLKQKEEVQPYLATARHLQQWPSTVETVDIIMKAATSSKS